MQPSKTNVIGLFNAAFQYQVPIFQRGYVWTLEKQVAPLWLDIQAQADALLERQALLAQPAAQAALKPLPKHFLGSIVMTPVPMAFNRVPMYEVIDGQQRSTTLHLLLLALRLAARSSGQDRLALMLDALVRNPGPYLVEPSDHYKVWPTQAGRQEMQQLHAAATVRQVCQAYPARNGRVRVERPLMVQTFLYLYHACLAYLQGLDLSDPADAAGSDPDRSHSDALVGAIRGNDDVQALAGDRAAHQERGEALFMALADQMQLMTLTLDADDDPQVIFETLNARGEPLLASDLVRNFLFLEAARQGQGVDALYDEYWRDFDQVTTQQRVTTANRYWRDKEKQGRLLHPRIDLFFYHYTVLRSQEPTLVAHVFQSFKAWWQRQPRVLQEELARIQTSSRHFAELITPEGTGPVAEFARLLKALDVGTVVPVVLALRERLERDSAELRQALGDLASYLVRRSVCGMTTKGYNRFFLRVLKAVCAAPQAPHEALRQALLDAKADSEVWPADQKFGDQWLARAVYTDLKPHKVCALLRALEYAARGSKTGSQHVPTAAALTVEHVMPQSWEKVPAYQLAAQDDAARQARQASLHAFGNLTLLTGALNACVSNGPFSDTIDAQGATVLGKRSLLGQSALLLNTAWFHRADVGHWDEAAIRQRAQALLRAALMVWGRPARPAAPDAVFQALAGR